MKIKEGQKVTILSSSGRYSAKAYVAFNTEKDDDFQLQLDQDKPLRHRGALYQRGDVFTENRKQCVLAPVPVEAKRKSVVG
jgi:hypothetical protein